MPSQYANAFANSTCFIAVTVGNIDFDDTLDVWYIDPNQELVNRVSDINDCIDCDTLHKEQHKPCP